MHLKSIEVHGFKTFATRTTLSFHPGLTAIVGPNGSGKSNIADAVRWVLGEQSMRSLRSRRTEDIIFSGGLGRPPLGMAEVTLTLDNADGWLPIEFSELAITRRAYRSGENEYLLNGSRILLRELLEVTSRLGQSYTIINQGLADAALALSAEDRRALFEEAADIKVYAAKRAQAEHKLVATNQNVQRVNDILTEIGPRLRSLERQAAKAQRYLLLEEELRARLRTWYVLALWRGERAASRLDDEHRRSLGRVEDARREEAHLEERRLGAQRRREDVLVLLRDLEGRCEVVRQQQQEFKRTRAVAEERRRNLARQLERFAAEEAEAERQRESAARRRTAIERELAEQRSGLEGLRAQLQAMEETNRSLEEQRHAARLVLQAAEEHVRGNEVQLREEMATLRQMRQRLGELEGEERKRERTIATVTALLAEASAKFEAARDARQRASEELRALSETERATSKQLDAAQVFARTLLGRLDQVERSIATSTATSETLSRVLDQRSGLSPAFLSWLRSRPGQAPAVLLADILEVPDGLEPAVEAAMGARLRDLICDSATILTEIVDRLKASGCGTTTVWALDRVRDARMGAAVGTHAQPLVGLVKTAPRYRNIIIHLLGRTYLVDDRDAAWRVLSGLPAGHTCVTPAGDLIHWSGSVTVRSSRTGGSSLLAVRRQMSELAEGLAQFGAERDALREEAQKSEERLQSLQEELRQQRERQQRLATGQRQAAELELRLQRDVERLEQDLQWQRRLDQQGAGELGTLRSRAETLGPVVARLEREIQEGRKLTAAERGKVDDLDRQSALARAAVAQSQREVAVSEEAIRGQLRLLESIRTQTMRLQSDSEAKSAQRTALQDEQTSIEEALRQLDQSLAEGEDGLATLSAAQHSRQHELEAIEQETQELDAQVQGGRDQILALEIEVNRAETTLRGHRLELERLRLEAVAEVGELPADRDETCSEEAEERLSAEVTDARARLRAMEPVNREAVAEHGELQARYTFLSDQLADLDGASRSLRRVIGDLDSLMDRQFSESFASVSEQFSHYFSLLFGGGEARLTLVSGEDGKPGGVDIFARPPGKRVQSMALLSGGERALTAIALLFALLHVRPTPFCFLDEIDAALDDANTRRFIDILKGFAGRTQFIVVTHNRGTMELAGALYGVTMGKDGVSKMLSLQLEEAHQHARSVALA